MSETRMKVLEMVAEGKITPDEAVRLLEALGEENAPTGQHWGSGWKFDMPDIRIPKIDLGQLGELCVELKNSVVEGARKAHGQFKHTRAARYFEFKDYPLSVGMPKGVEKCLLQLDVRAGKLKLRGGGTEGELLAGRVKRVPEEPRVFSEQRGNHVDLTFKHSLGRCGVRVSTVPVYTVKLANAAGDTRLSMEELRVEKLEINNNAGNVVAELGGGVATLNVDIDNNAGNVRLKLPSSHSLRVTVQGSLSTHNLERYGLEVLDGVAIASDWDSNPLRIEVLLGQNVASFQLDWKRRDGVKVGEDLPELPHDEDDEV